MVIRTCGSIERHVGGLVTENLISIFRRQRKDWDEVSCSEIRQALFLMGHADPVKGKGVRILSGDESGSGGVVPIEILRKLEDLCQQRIGEMIDFVIGVSSDTVLLSIAKVSLDECEHLYIEMSKTIFERNRFLGTGNFLNHTFYDKKGWMKISSYNFCRSHFQGMSSMQINETARDPNCPKWVESYAPWMGEKVGKIPKGSIEDKNLLENKRIRKECKRHDNERSTSCQHAELFGDRCGGSNQHPAQKKLEDKADRKLSNGKQVKKEEGKGGDTHSNSRFRQTEPVKPIDGTRPPDVGKCLNGTTSIKTLRIYALMLVEALGCIFWGVLSKNLRWYQYLENLSKIEKGKSQPPSKLLKTPNIVLKVGKQRQVLKTSSYGSQKHHRTGAKRHILIVMIISRCGCGLAASIPTTHVPSTTESRVTEKLPLACTNINNGSKENDTWLDRSEVEKMISGGTFDRSHRGYTDICPNAFYGFRLNEIDLSFNNITEISDDLFENVPGLERVHLGCNRLTSFPVALNKCPDLVFFNISCNNIRNIPRNSFNKATNLQGFDASGNVNISQYPDDLFYLPNLLIVYLGNTSISSAPFPPHPNTRASESIRLKCEKGQIIRLVIENREIIFHLQNTDALSPKNWVVKVDGVPEGWVGHYDCENQTFGPFEIVENDRSTTRIPMTTLNNYDFSSTVTSVCDATQNDRSTTLIPMTTLNNYDFSSTLTSVSDATQNDRSTTLIPVTTLNDHVFSAFVTSVSDATPPQNDFNAPQKRLIAGVVIIVIFQDILLFYFLHWKGIDKSPHYEKVGVFVVKMLECIFAWPLCGIRVALSLFVESLVTVSAAHVYSYVLLKKNNSASTPVGKVVYDAVYQTASINDPEGDDQS